MKKLLFILLILLILMSSACLEAEVVQEEEVTVYKDDTPTNPDLLYIVLTMDTEEKDDNLGIHGGILDAMLDIFEEEGLTGKVEILMPVDDWEVVVKDNLSVVKRINHYPISLHTDRHVKFTFQEKEVQRQRISSSIAWIKNHFKYSGMVFRAPILMEGETTRDVLSDAGISYDLTPQIYSTVFFPVLVRPYLSLLPTSIIITGGFPDYTPQEATEVNMQYMESFDHIYQQAKNEGPAVAVALLHPTNWNNESVKLLRDNLRYIKSMPGVEFIIAKEIASHVPVLGKNPFEFSPKVGVIVEPREDYNPEKESFNDETFLLYTLRGYGLKVERADLSSENYDVVVYYSPTGREPSIEAVILNKNKLSGITPEALLDPRKSESNDPEELRCELLKELLNIEKFSKLALEDAKAFGTTPYLKKALNASDLCDMLRFAYLSREYAIQIKSVQSSKENVSKYSIAEGEIPLIYYGTVDGVHLGYQEAPHATAQVAREAFHAYEKTGSKENLSRALFLVDHLLNTAEDSGDYMVWEYAFPWPGYSLEKGWRGSLGQAGILKALILAYKHTGEERYRLASQKTLNAFSVPVDEGGLLKLREGYAWYPEYVKETPPYVLNGFATSLIWIREYHEATADPLAEKLFNEGISSLTHFLPTYNLENGSYYDAMRHIASPHYHSIHVYQMKTLFEMTGNPIFQEYQLKWNASSQR